MKKSILNLGKVLTKNEKREILGGNPIGFSLSMGQYAGCAGRAAMEVQDALLESPFMIQEDQQALYDEVFEYCMELGPLDWASF